MTDSIAWVIENWMFILGVIGTVSMGASIIMKAIAPLTDNKIDDSVAKWLTVVYKWINKIAINPKLDSDKKEE